MHKKLAADLTSLAHSILQMKNKEDVFALKTKAHEVYEKLAVLAYVEEYINNTPNSEYTKDELLELVNKSSENLEKEIKIEDDIEQFDTTETIEEDVVTIEDQEALNEHSSEELPSEEIELLIDESLVGFNESEEKDDLFSQSEEILEEILEENSEVIDNTNTTDVIHSLEDELKDTIAADVVADLFENAPKKSLNDTLQGDIQIGLNDRIAFVKSLFGGSQEDFNRVVSQLNSFKTQKEAKKFIHKMVKPDYDWADKEEIEERFMTIIERKFL
ncbi:MAG: hypothetical protein P8Q53_05245 [Flavobacteriaceae bacterium]|nr:hypothetical protein [Flavobacteriaceae bacterium]MDG2274845.1 hypothetical protein [Flavobacteriaceae bacterium]